MEKLLLAVALACQPGDRLVDFGGRLPRDLQFIDLVISVKPFLCAALCLSTRLP